MSELSIPQIIELADGLKCVRLEDFIKAREHYSQVNEMAEQAFRERDEAKSERDILRLDAQREAEHHDRMVKELEGLYDKLKS